MSMSSNELQAQAHAQAWATQLQQALEVGDVQSATELFGDECYWRELTALTWNLHTSEGKEDIAKMLLGIERGAWERNIQVTRAADTAGFIEAWFSFENDRREGLGL